MKPVLVLLAVLLALLAPLTAHAQLNAPDTVAIEAVRVFRHMLEPDDMLLVARYNISYADPADQPAQPVDAVFNFEYLDAGGNSTGNKTAYPFFNMGYSKGLVAFYWTGGDDPAPGWDDLGELTLGNVTPMTGPSSASYNLVAADYSPYVNPGDQREDLRQWLTAQMMFLDLAWNNWYASQGFQERQIDLLAEVSPGYTVLAPAGESYMLKVIPELRRMCPLLFMLQVFHPQHSYREWEREQQSIYEGIHEGTPVGDATEGLSGLMGGIGAVWAATVLTLLAGLAVILFCQQKYQKANIGMLTAYAIVLLATPEGFVQMGIMALFAVIATLQLADTFWWRRSHG